jgi:hypothetical protein
MTPAHASCTGSTRRLLQHKPASSRAGDSHTPSVEALGVWPLNLRVRHVDARATVGCHANDPRGVGVEAARLWVAWKWRMQAAGTRVTHPSR